MLKILSEIEVDSPYLKKNVSEYVSYINGEKLHSEKVSESGMISVVLDKSSVTDDYFTLEIAASACINPKVAGLGEDQRDLSWMLNLIEQQ